MFLINIFRLLFYLALLILIYYCLYLYLRLLFLFFQNTQNIHQLDLCFLAAFIGFYLL